MHFRPFRFILSLFVVSTIFASCQKEFSEENGLLPSTTPTTPTTPGTPGTPTTPGDSSTAECKACIYLPFCDSSRFIYVDSTGGVATEVLVPIDIVADSTIDGKVYQKFVQGTAVGFVNCTAGVSSTVFFNLNSSTGIVDRVNAIQLKADAAVGETWQDTNINAMGQGFQYDYKIISKGTSRTVLGVTYPDVIHVYYTTSITFMGNTIIGSETDNYFARGVGIIETSTREESSGTIAYHRVLKTYFIP